MKSIRYFGNRAKTLLKFFSYSSKTKSFVKKYFNKNSLGTGKKILIVLESWDWTVVPFFEIVLGTLLSQENKITFLIDDLNFGDDLSIIQKIEFFLIKNSVSSVDYKKLSDVNIKDETVDEIWLDFSVEVNSIHQSKGEFSVNKRYEDIIRKQLMTANLYLNNFDFKSYDKIIFPGGLCQDSNILVRICEKYDLEYYTFDAGLEKLLLSAYRGIAPQLGDIYKSFDMFYKEFEYIDVWKEKAKKELLAREMGSDSFNCQIIAKKDFSEQENIGYLLMMNSVWDSAALGIHTVYTKYKDWVFDTINFILNNTDDNITIREHPADRFDFQRSNDNYKEVIEKNFANNNRVKFISATDKVNSYSLIENAKCVLVFSSTVALEAVVKGKPVICVSDCYYSNIDFVCKVHSRDQYYKELIQIGDRIVTEEMKKKALAVYFLTQKCNFVRTIFTPSEPDFREYINYSIDELKGKNNVKEYIDSINKEVPISYLIAKRTIEDENYENLAD